MRALVVPFVLLMVISACAIPAPETMRQKLATAEIAYQAAIQSALDLRASGKITKGSATDDKVKLAATSVNNGLIEWRAQVDNPDRQVAVMASLATLQRLLAEIRRQ
jgi:hypothetical protein